jgi:hypothetical protein
VSDRQAIALFARRRQCPGKNHLRHFAAARDMRGRGSQTLSGRIPVENRHASEARGFSTAKCPRPESNQRTR